VAVSASRDIEAARRRRSRSTRPCASSWRMWFARRAASRRVARTRPSGRSPLTLRGRMGPWPD
jgi:hypothetical protein